MQSNFRSSFFNLSPTALNSITALFATTYQRARHNYSSHVRSSLRNDDTSSRRFTFTFTSLDNRANNCKLARETRVQMLSRGRIGDNSRRNRGKTGWKRIVSIPRLEQRRAKWRGDLIRAPPFRTIPIGNVSSL